MWRDRAGRTHAGMGALFALLAGVALCCVTALAADDPPAEFILITATAVTSDGASTKATAVLTVHARPAPTIAEAKTLPDGEPVSLSDLVVSGDTTDFAGVFYAQQRNQIGAIGIIWSGETRRGEVVLVTGDLTTRNGERLIKAGAVSLCEAPAP